MSNTEIDAPTPKVSIVMAAYNEERDIKNALDSILAQSFTDWELIIIDDGSTDATATIINNYAEKDRRIKLICNESNLELSASLNRGIGLARSELIARADADDINLPERLSKQYDYMQEHPETDVLGTAAYLLDQAGERANIYSHPQTHAELAALSFLKIQFFHPSVMIRKRFFEVVGLYDPNYPNAEDKHLWLRGLEAGRCYANLPEPLIEYSTDGYVKSWKAIVKHARALLRMSKELKVKRGYILTLSLFAYTAAIKLKLYKPKSLRLNQGISSSG